MPKIVLDPATFKVLASDTRLDILRMLDQRPRTVSELSRDLRLNKATVFEHLQVLTAAQLVQKVEREGSKWVYYKLNWKGKNLLHPENTTIFVLLSLAGAGLAGGVIALGKWLGWWLAQQGAGLPGGDEEGAGSSRAPEQEEAEQGPPAEGEPAADEAQRQEMLADTPAKEGPAAEDGGGWEFLRDNDFLLFALLGLLFVVGALVTALTWRRSRRLATVERAAMEARLAARPPLAEEGAAGESLAA